MHKYLQIPINQHNMVTRGVTGIAPPRPGQVNYVVRGPPCVNADEAEFPNMDLKSALQKKRSDMTLL